MAKRIYCIRGAVCAENTEASIRENVGNMCREIFSSNKIDSNDLVSIHFTMTRDLDVLNAAKALRLSDVGIDVTGTALFTSQEAEIKGMIHMLEVLQNFNEIQDLNYHQFISCCEKFAQEYDGKIFEQVIQKIRYQKRTISFLRDILNHYGVENSLNKYLSALSQYKHPTMEEIYEIAYSS